MYIFFLNNVSLISSLLFHLIIITFFSLQLPHFALKKSRPALQNQVIVIDTISLGEMNNIKLQGKTGTIYEKNVYNGLSNKHSEVKNTVEKKKTEKMEVKKKEGLLLNSKKIQTVNDKQNNPKNTSKTSPVENSNKQKHDSSQDELSSILKSIQKSQSESKVSNVDNNKNGVLGKGEVSYNKKNPVTIKAIDSIRSKFIKCWTVPTGAKDVENLRISIHVMLASNGKVISANINDSYNYNHNPFFRAMADSALRAVYRCSPLSDLPESQYQTWREIELNFDPKDMF